MKLWGGRFSGHRDPLFEQFSESFSLDQRLILYDLRVNRAYVAALGRAKVLSGKDVRALARGLDTIAREVSRRPGWARRQSSEDIHTWVEARLEREVGKVASRLRTGRSRNDLVATDTRLYLKDAVRELEHAIVEFLEALVFQARQNPRAVVPGFTHLQPAQPILFSHYLLAYFEMLSRDLTRLEDCRKRADELPMGAGALAGAAYPVDRVRLARELGFRRACRNSLDATSDRDYVSELLFACSLTMVHLSRLAEDLIVYSSPAFGFVQMSDAYATGSSLMPQKKNPDALELIRGKAAMAIGKASGFLAVLKGLPLGYDRDLQEDKAALFDVVETTRASLRVGARVIRTLGVNAGRMEAETARGFLTATDVADALVRRGIPFAEAHDQVGKLVNFCEERKITFAEVGSDDARHVIPLWDFELAEVAKSARHSVDRRNVKGGTAPSRVGRELAAAAHAVRRWQRRCAGG
jgi:argininosuccinate lyase